MATVMNIIRTHYVCIPIHCSLHVAPYMGCRGQLLHLLFKATATEKAICNHYAHIPDSLSNRFLIFPDQCIHYLPPAACKMAGAAAGICGVYVDTRHDMQ